MDLVSISRTGKKKGQTAFIQSRRRREDQTTEILNPLLLQTLILVASTQTDVRNTK
jgi:hypothetical protein